MTKLPTGRHTQTIKSARKNAKKYESNKALKTRAKSYARKVREAAESGKKKEIRDLYRQACKYIDIAASKGVIHKNKASRLKGRLAKKVNQTKS